MASSDSLRGGLTRSTWMSRVVAHDHLQTVMVERLRPLPSRQGRAARDAGEEALSVSSKASGRALVGTPRRSIEICWPRGARRLVVPRLTQSRAVTLRRAGAARSYTVKWCNPPAPPPESRRLGRVRFYESGHGSLQTSRYDRLPDPGENGARVARLGAGIDMPLSESLHAWGAP